MYGEQMLSALSNLSHTAYLSVSGEKLKKGDVSRGINAILKLSKKLSSKKVRSGAIPATNMMFTEGALNAFVKNPSFGENVPEMGTYIAQQSGLYTDAHLKTHIFMEVSSSSIPRLYSDIFKLREAIVKESQNDKTQSNAIMSLSFSFEQRVKNISNKLRKACSLGDASKSVAVVANIAKLNSAYSEFNVIMAKFWQGRSYDSKRALLALANIEKASSELWKETNKAFGNAIEKRVKSVIDDCKFFCVIFAGVGVVSIFISVIIIRSLLSAVRRTKKFSNFIANSDLMSLRDYAENTAGRIEPFSSIDKNITSVAEKLSDTVESAKKAFESSSKIAEDAMSIVSIQKPRLNSVQNGLLRVDAKIHLRDKSDSALSEAVQNLRDKLGVLEQGARLQDKSVSAVSADIVSTSNLASKVLESLASLRDTANKMSVIAETFTALADQANILGLNLAIETAKAGIKGSGLGTLSEQIKILSKRTVVSVIDIESVRDLIVETIDKRSGDVEKFLSSLDSDAKILEEIEAETANLTTTLSELSSVANSISTSLRERETSDMSVDEARENVARVDESLSDFAEFAKSAVQELSHLHSKF